MVSSAAAALSAPERASFAPGLIKGATYKGGIYGVPLFSDQGFFYYREDLLAKAHLPVPTTWEQVQSESETLQKMGLVKYGMIFQGASYEGLTCNFTAFLTDAGGSILNSSSTAAAVDSSQGVKALTYLRGLITSGVTPAAVTSFQEPQAMSVFESGDAAFLRNWAYAWGDANDPSTSKVVGKVGVSLPPTFAGQTGPGYSSIGGWNAYINLTFNSSNAFRTIPVGISLFGTEFTLPYGPIFAGSVVAILPIVMIVLIFKRNVISGLTAGAIK